jgi:hypothetical protein
VLRHENFGNTHAHTQIMLISLDAGMESYLIAKPGVVQLVPSLIISASKVSQVFPVSGNSQVPIYDIWYICFIRTRLRRSCHAAVYGICNSRLPSTSIKNGFHLPYRLFNSHEDSHRFLSYKCILGFQSCHTTSVSMPKNVDP